MSAAELGDSEARKTVETAFNNVLVELPVGIMTAREDVTVSLFSNGVVSMAVYDDLLAAEYAGLLKIERLKGDTFQFGVPAIPPNISSQKMRITLTKNGSELNRWKRPPDWTFSFGLLTLPQGHFKIGRIVKNEEMKKAGQEYRLLLFTFKAEWDPLYLDIAYQAKKYANIRTHGCTACGPGLNLSNNRKSRMVLKMDDFKGSWKIITYDVANEEDEFTTNAVGKFLNDIGL